MNCNVIGFVTLDQVLRFSLCGVINITLKRNVGNNPPDDYALDSTRFRVPRDMITAFECPAHRNGAILAEQHPALQEKLPDSDALAGRRKVHPRVKKRRE